MELKRSIITFSIAILTSIGVSVFIYWYTRPKIGYVRSQELIMGYAGTKDAQYSYKEKITGMQSNLDSLITEFNKVQENFKLVKSPNEKSSLNEELTQKQMDIQKYSQAIESMSQQEESKALEGVLNQVNSFIYDYGEQHDYDLILGTTLSGSILYGTKVIDITDPILKLLNDHYKGDEKK
ncbi:MAG: OmpH family outer membrane protein [Bacteroidia bacterium]|nr:OmpH family outer membrane protein [Bacteroidia bacterium]